MSEQLTSADVDRIEARLRWIEECLSEATSYPWAERTHISRDKTVRHIYQFVTDEGIATIDESNPAAANNAHLISSAPTFIGEMLLNERSLVAALRAAWAENERLGESQSDDDITFPEVRKETVRGQFSGNVIRPEFPGTEE